jgi:hypothetical protein
VFFEGAARLAILLVALTFEVMSATEFAYACRQLGKPAAPQSGSAGESGGAPTIADEVGGAQRGLTQAGPSRELAG